MKKFKDNMLLQILLGAVILIVFIIVLAQFTNTSSQEENTNTFRNESENTTVNQGQTIENEDNENQDTETNEIEDITLSFESVEKINTDKAIVTLTYGDTYWDIFDNDEQFEIKAIVNADTKILSKSNLSNSIDTIENSKHDMIMIDLDPDTIYDENPVITVYESSDN